VSLEKNFRDVGESIQCINSTVKEMLIYAKRTIVVQMLTRCNEVCGQTVHAAPYFDSLTGRWINSSHNLFLVKLLVVV